MNKLTMSGVLCSLLAAVFLSGCATVTSITSEGGNPDMAKAGPYKKVFIAAALKSEDSRKEMENAFQVALEARGLSGVPSHVSITTTGEVAKADLAKIIKKNGADSVLLVNVRGRESATKVTTFDNSRANYSYFSSYGNSMLGAAPAVYQYEIVDLEAQLFDVATENVVWSIRTESLDPKKLQKAINGYAALITDRLAELGYLVVTP